MQMGSACGVLDVQLLAAKVRSEDSKLRWLGTASQPSKPGTLPGKYIGF